MNWRDASDHSGDAQLGVLAVAEDGHGREVFVLTAWWEYGSEWRTIMANGLGWHVSPSSLRVVRWTELPTSELNSESRKVVEDARKSTEIVLR